MSPSISQLKRLIATNQTEKALHHLQQWLSQADSAQENELVLFQSRYRQVVEPFQQGRISVQEYQLERRKFEYDFLNFLDALRPLFAEDAEGAATPAGPPSGEAQMDAPLEAGVGASLASSDPQALIGTRIQHYVLTQFIGSGGFGQVFKAHHSRMSHTVAIKLSYPIEATEAFVKDLIFSNMQGLGQLDHPGIVRLYDLGELLQGDRSRIYAVMEYVPGTPLSHLKRSGLTADNLNQRQELFLRICEALDYAHQFSPKQAGFASRRILHGDLKPPNVLVRPDQRPVVLDFMLADLQVLYQLNMHRPSVAMGENLTQAFGTAGYMAPEQARQGVVTEQTDVYGLGTILFELVCPYPFIPMEQVGNHWKDLHAILKRPTPHIPRRISQAIHRATQPQPEDRFPSVRKIMDFLQASGGILSRFAR